MHRSFFSNRFFSGMPLEVLEPLRIKEIHLPAGTVIFEEGSSGSTLLLVGEGRVKISISGNRGKEEILSTICPDDFFGELAVLDRGLRSASATTLEPTLLGEIDRRTLDRLMASSPTVLPLNFTQAVVQRLRQANARFIEQVVRTERLTLLGTMLSSIVHDLKNPISAILATSDYLEQKTNDEFTRTAAATIQSSAQRVWLMVEELLDFSRGTVRLKPFWTDAARLLDLLEHEILFQIRQTPVRLVTECRSSERFLLDEVRVTRCVANLVKNAHEAIADRGELAIRLIDENSGLLISVSDSGPGIPTAISEKIFEPFVSLNKPHGTGLGLAIAKACVDAHRGRIWFESSSSGTQFMVWLPREGILESASFDPSSGLRL
jgi:signal transduction histidine kinase